jgi:3-oxoacyl-[acyl-carrier protein] reductase
MRIIRGRKAVVTGAASGIGRAIALALAREGADLFLIDRDVALLTTVAQDAARHQVAVVATVCDLAVPAEITRTINQVRATWDSVNILVNCAGVACYGPYHLVPEAAVRQTMAVNLLAPMQIVHELLPSLLSATDAHILNVCSFLGLVPTRKVPVYQASKYGLVGFTLALRSDYHRDHFGVTALCPGFVLTPLLANATDPESHRPAPSPPDFLATTPDAVAATAIAAIRRNRGLVIVTPLARLTWWVARLCPPLVDWFNREGWRRRGRIKLPDAPR